MKQLKVSLIVVTYAERHHFARKVITYALKQNQISTIIIVDNNSTKKSQECYTQLSVKNKKRVRVLRNNTNPGPGAAIAAGLKLVQKEKLSDFCWILDDDNLPRQNALGKLLEHWDSCELKDKENNLMFASYRQDRPQYQKAVELNMPEIITGPKNVFRTLHLKQVIQKMLKIRPEKDRPDQINQGEVPVAPYGGMFFHVKLLKKIGFPDKDYCIYFDDYEYSRRVYTHGGKIILVSSSKIMDQEESWYNKGLGFVKLATFTNKGVLYYSIRNRILFEKQHLVSNRLVYYTHAAIYFSVVALIMIARMRFVNLAVFWSAFWDGMHGKKYLKYTL